MSMDGIFFIDKPAGVTSRDVVDTIIRKTETRKVGHTGTLDPIATGLLIVCVGKATKLVDLLTVEDKEYEAEVCLGVETDTLDKEGKVVKKEFTSLREEEIDSVLRQFIGTYNQEVPKYSAIKVQGKKLYEYARENIEVTLPKRMVHIYELERISPVRKVGECTYFSIRTKVSKGTYIRSLIRDIAVSLNTVGYMNSLRRTKQGEYTIDLATPLEDIHLADKKPVSFVLKNIYEVICDDVLKKDVLNGKILKNIYNRERVVFKDQEGDVLAIYQKYEKEEGKLKPYVMLGGIK